MNTRGPFIVRPYWQHGGGHPILHLLVLLVIVALLVAGGVWLFRRLAQPQVGAGGPAAADPLGIVRLRYARGEIGPDEFRRMSVDLGAAPDAFGPSSATSEAPTQPGGPAAPAG
jgi:uncharacterized membrane protein